MEEAVKAEQRVLAKAEHTKETSPSPHHVSWTKERDFVQDPGVMQTTWEYSRSIEGPGTQERLFPLLEGDTGTAEHTCDRLAKRAHLKTTWAYILVDQVPVSDL